jgi:hypothetical protein
VHTSVYAPLREWLRSQPGGRLTLSFDEMERLLGRPLPPSARTTRTWWNNTARGRSQARAWLEAGWRARDLDRRAGSIAFVRS